MGLFDDLDTMLDEANEDIYGKYTLEEQELINSWNNKLGDSNALSSTVFRDADFLHNFLESVLEKEQFDYALNTYNMFLGKEYDPKYVIVTRRSVPSLESKPEAFWTTEHREVKAGLKQEMPEGSPQRLHSAIMVSTLERLINHGLSNTNGGASDGEIVIDPTKSFSDFLFIYKPENEMEKLNEYLENGGMTRDELLEIYKNSALERLEAQGFDDEKKNR